MNSPATAIPGSRVLLQVQGQRDEAEEVAEGGEAHRAREQAAIAHGQAPAAAAIIFAACSMVAARSCDGENSTTSVSSSTTTLWPGGR